MESCSSNTNIPNISAQGNKMLSSPQLGLWSHLLDEESVPRGGRAGGGASARSVA
jgi:hypothetical protein